jgi:hypothetical protein
MSKESKLDQWLEENHFFNRTKDTPVPSHLLYTGFKGGKLYVPRDKEYDFLCQYAAEMCRGTPLYIVETRPRTFKYMVDIDISDDHYWSFEEIVKIVAVVQSTVYQFFETNQVTICCTSPAKMKNDGIHTGIHLIWPNLFVTSDTALCIRRGIIQKLKENDKTLEKSFNVKKSWEDIMDETIYTRNGYRMVGSDKMSPNKDKQKVAENRPLSLLFVMDSEGQLSDIYYNRLKKDTKALVLETSIRYVIDTYLNQGMNINKFPIWLDEDPLQKKAGSKNQGVAGTVVSGKEHIIIENFIRKHLPKAYSRQVVKAVTRYPDKNLLVKTNSKFCMNLGREHASCGIYFFASPTGIYIKCLCPCNKLEGRKNGLCMDYTSECYPFDEDIRTILFPEFDKNLFEEEKDKKKKEYVKKLKEEKKKKLKEQTKFIPDTKTNIEKQQKKTVDKLLADIMR